MKKRGGRIRSKKKSKLLFGRSGTAGKGHTTNVTEGREEDRKQKGPLERANHIKGSFLSRGKITEKARPRALGQARWKGEKDAGSCPRSCNLILGKETLTEWERKNAPRSIWETGWRQEGKRQERRLGTEPGSLSFDS